MKEASKVVRDKIMNNINLIFWIAITIIFFLRLIHIDSDVPPTGVINYQPIDEGAYSFLAINKWKYGLINPDSLSNAIQYTAPYTRGNILGNILTYIGFSIFGNNYLGLRFASFISVFVSIILVYKIILEINKENMSRRTMLIARISVLVLTFDFTFLVASRVNETTVFRMLFVLIVVYMFIKKQHVPKYHFLISFIAMFSFSLIYITNIFLVIAYIALLGAMIVLDKENRNINCQKLGFAILGVLACLFITEVYLKVYWDTTLLANTLSSITSFSTVDKYKTTSTIFALLKRVVEFLATNYSLYNIGILVVFLYLLPKNIKEGFIKKNYNILFLLFIIGAFFCQTLYTEDFIRRKFIVIAPLLIILIAYSLNTNDIYYKTVFAKLSSSLSCIVIALGIIGYRMFIVRDGSRIDFATIDKLVILATSLIALILFIQFVALPKRSMKVLKLIACITILCNVFLSAKYVFINPTFSERNIMLQLGEDLTDSEYVVGTFSLGYSLYNNQKPVLNKTDKMIEILINNPSYYYIDYANTVENDLTNYLSGLTEGTEYSLIEIKRYEREFQRYGSKRPIALYKIHKNGEENLNE